MILSRTGILVIIVIAQFACVSLWFAGNAVLDELITEFHLSQKTLGHLISAVQLGFITGTLVYAIYAFADKFSPSTVFFISAIAGSISNLGIIMADGNVAVMYGSRFMTGFFLAGIYPVGMKIAADYFDKDLGRALGYLLGGLVLGTAFPHLLNSMLIPLQWEGVLISISIIALAGGMMVFFLIPDGPFRKMANSFKGGRIFALFRNNNFRIASFGYFGHMWELYAFWTFVPVIISTLISSVDESQVAVSRFTFIIIGVGSIACILGGYMARRLGSYQVALMALAFSGTCCLVSPLLFTLNPAFIYVFLLFWGMVVIMDSPQFSTLIAQTAPVENKGSALTIVNCIGFTITVLSIQLLNMLSGYISLQWLFIFLFPGPVFGLIALLQWDSSRQV